MAIPLDQERANYPAIKLATVNDSISVACVRVRTVPMTAYGSGEKVMGKDGKPREQDIVTGIVTAGTAIITDGDTLRQVVKGDVVNIYLKKQSRWEFFQAKNLLKKTTGEGMAVGDLLKYTWTGTEPGQAAGTTKKVYTVVMGKPKEADAARTAECERLYHLSAGEAAPEQTGEQYHDDSPDDPFADE